MYRLRGGSVGGVVSVVGGVEGRERGPDVQRQG